jgi:hypothetical protein
LKEALENLFTHYLKSFRDYNLQGVCHCYAIPCTLNTPERILLIEDFNACEKEFSAIFEQLKQEKTKDIVVQQSSFMVLSKSLLLVSIDWDFINQSEDVFASFCAFYHIALEMKDKNIQLKIVNVASHQSENSLLLKNEFLIS